MDPVSHNNDLLQILSSYATGTNILVVRCTILIYQGEKVVLCQGMQLIEETSPTHFAFRNVEYSLACYSWIV